jgi:putative flippase GtrA
MDAAGLSIAMPPRGRLRQIFDESWRYFAASLAALGVDYGLLVALTELARLHYLTASAIAYVTGSVFHYVLCVALVFKTRPVADRRVELAAFVGIGLVGLAVTQAVLKVSVEWLGLSYLVGKVFATGLSFVLNFVARRAILFTAARASA